MGWIETYALGGLLLRGTVPMQQVFMLAGALTMCLMALYLAGISCRGGWDIRVRVFCEVFPAVVFPVATESLGPLRSSTAIHARLGKRRQDSARVRDQAARPESAKPGSDRDSFPDQPVTAFRRAHARARVINAANQRGQAHLFTQYPRNTQRDSVKMDATAAWHARILPNNSSLAP